MITDDGAIARVGRTILSFSPGTPQPRHLISLSLHIVSYEGVREGQSWGYGDT